MGTIFTYNSYENRSVDVPTGSPLFKHIRENEDKEKNVYNFTNPTNPTTPPNPKIPTHPTNYEMLIKELQNSKKNKYPSSEYSASLCCREREGYGSDFNRQNI